MEQVVRASVRQLVEFSIHGEDLAPGGSLQDMRLGALGHKARQSLLPEGWEAEKSLSGIFEKNGITLHLSGRMDACSEAEPAIEEIKLWQGSQPPETPVPAHWAQGVVYGYLWQKEQVSIRLCYVDTAGRVLAHFEENLTQEDCRQVFEPLLEAYTAWHAQLNRHLKRRNQQLSAMDFPYPAYRAGQREMAVQCYTAISQRKRLFASMPTGTGKSAAVLFPALKALGKGLTGQIFYLTARNTGRQGAQDLLTRIQDRRPLPLWVLPLEAKDRVCPCRTRCHPDDCPRAKGFLIRLEAALEKMTALDSWSPTLITETAEEFFLCPFEFRLSLAEIADVVIGDYNYAFDPGAYIRRIFDRRYDLTLLVDEAHHLRERAQEMLTARLDGGQLALLRREVGRLAGRKHPLYQAMTAMLRALEAREETDGLFDAAEDLISALADAFGTLPGMDYAALTEWSSELMTLVRAKGQAHYAWLWSGGKKTPRLTALCLSVGAHLGRITQKLRGVICFSATFDSLPVMRELLGGDEADACLALPSPFPKENLLTLRLPIDTRYQAREQTADAVAAAIRKGFEAHPGKYMAFFPSFAYLEMIRPLLEGLPVQAQTPGMAEEERRAFLNMFQEGEAPVLGLCVLGGLFGEGIDLSGEKLIGVMIVGVGLPQVNEEQEALRDYYQQLNGQGFGYAYQIPGMQKITQAVGRVIRNETDRGVALLIDQRYFQRSYEQLCPPHWQWQTKNWQEALEVFWQGG